MILGLILFVSLAPGFYVVWRVGGEQVWRSLERQKRAYPYSNASKMLPSGENYFAGVALGLLAFFVWPYFVFIWLGGRDGSGFHRLVYVPPEYRRAAYEKRIAELEREVGIG